jgi:hypothetical protein
MTSPLDPNAADKLVRICGLLGSAYDGERAAAALKADRLVRALGLTWSDVITSRAPITCSTVEDQIDFALQHGEDVLNVWELGFLDGVRGRQFLTKKQLAKLAAIVAKVTEGRAQ